MVILHTGFLSFILSVCETLIKWQIVCTILDKNYDQTTLEKTSVTSFQATKWQDTQMMQKAKL